MNKKLFLNFLKDYGDFSLLYFLNSFLISLFYYLFFGNKTEVIYPTSIALFLYIIFMIYKWTRYHYYNSRLPKFIKNYNYDLEAYTQEQKSVVALVNEFHQSSLENISSIKLENKTNKQFLSQWIHNMKTPVTVIDLIIQKSLKGEIISSKALQHIKEENVKLLNSLEQVLGIIRLEDFSRDYVPEIVDLASALKTIINKRKNQFIYNKVYPKFEIPVEEVLVLSDRKWNEAMLDQLISNAIKYSDTKAKEKNVYFTLSQEAHKVILTIKDQGIGIPEYDIRRVFEPFFTGKNGRRFENATGIGLYFCSEVARKLGHELSINSMEGEGTEVIIRYLSKL